jgi:Na+:H+ antiporter, NhaA family
MAGVTGGSWLTTKPTRAELSPDPQWIDVFGMPRLAGIGLTVSPLITELGFADPPEHLAHARAGP